MAAAQTPVTFKFGRTNVRNFSKGEMLSVNFNPTNDVGTLECTLVLMCNVEEV